MTPHSPDLDLLVIGGLTIDRFADGSSAAGGSVLHFARAASPRGVRVGVVTMAGPEPEARAGLDELSALATVLLADAAPATLTFRHLETGGRRRLWLERTGARLQLSADRIFPPAAALLVAPVASEVDASSLGRTNGAGRRGAILQGWLRAQRQDGEIQPVPLAAMDEGILVALRSFDLLVASREDLAAEPGDPDELLSAMRRTFGPRPDLVVTDGERGAWIQPAVRRADGARHIAVSESIGGVTTVGSGDVFAGWLLLGAARGDGDPLGDALEGRVRRAMQVVAEVLRERRRD